MKKIFIFILILISMVSVNCRNNNSEKNNAEAKNISGNQGEVKQINAEEFKKLIYNFDENKEWKYSGSMPALVDFYADWCPPCRQLSPLVEEVAIEYQGKIVVYKINTDQEKALAQSLGITNLPTLLYVPVNGKPQVTLGYISKEAIIKTMKEILLTR